MNETMVSSMIVALDEYATVQEEALLSEVVVALKQAQRDFKSKHAHRAVLVLDKKGCVTGKVSQHDILVALENRSLKLTPGGMIGAFLQKLVEQNEAVFDGLVDVHNKMAKKVTEFMYTPAKDEYIEQDASLKTAIHQLVKGHHHSLLVTRSQRDKKVVGVLRLVDVFEKAFEEIN